MLGKSAQFGITQLSRLTRGARMTLYPLASLRTLRAAQFPRSAPNRSSSTTFPAQGLNEAASLRRGPTWSYREYGCDITVAKISWRVNPTLILGRYNIYLC